MKLLKNLRTLQICSLACLLFFMAASSIYADGKQASFLCGGCKTEYYLIQELFNAFNAEGRVLQIGNKRAIELMLQKKIAFAFTCKPIDKLSKKLEIDRDITSTWESIPIAIDPLVVVSNLQNGINNITKEQLTAIAAGKITNWKEVGGGDLTIQFIYLDPETESGALLLFKEFTVGEGGEFTHNSKKMGTPSALGRVLSKTPGGLTFMGRNSYRKEFGNIMKIDNIEPNDISIFNGKYPLSVTYYLTIERERSHDVSDFIKFCFSERGQEIIRANHVPYSPLSNLQK